MSLFKRTNYRPSKFRGQFIFQDFSYGMYNLDIPRMLEEQITSLAMTGGRNVWTVRGVLTNQYGYITQGQLNEGDYPIFVSSSSSLDNNILIVGHSGVVYNYTKIQGLKKYKTELTDIDDFVGTYGGGNLYIYASDAKYRFGGRYNSELDAGVTFVPIIEEREDVTSDFRVPITEEEASYLWDGKELVIQTTQNSETVYLNIDCITVAKYPDADEEDEYQYYADFMFSNPEEAISISEAVTIGEKTLEELGETDFKWIPEEGDIAVPERVLNPKMMAVALNRLWVVDQDNTVFYSAVGNMKSFDEANGAGFFRGFYQDNSKILSIEEFFSGVLITKENGMYHIRLTTKEYSYGVGSGSEANYINIDKINNIAQTFEGDHVVIGDEVIAFDSKSGNLVQAAYVNYMGNIQQGSILLHGSEIDSNMIGLTSSPKRVLAYNYDEEVLLVYYDTNLSKALVIPRNLSIYPREIDKSLTNVSMFSQGFINITSDGLIIEDFKRGTIVPEMESIVEFEPISLRSNKMLCGSIIEFTELNGVDFKVATSNITQAYQEVNPSMVRAEIDSSLPNLIYSDKNLKIINNSYAEESKWAAQKSALSRIAAPLSGRNGLGITLEFGKNITFQLCSIYFPDLSRGE